MSTVSQLASRVASTTPVQVGEQVVHLTRSRDVTFVAAGVAYYALASLVPMLLLAFAVATALGLELLLEQVLESVGHLLTATGQQLLADALADATGRAGASVVGLVGFLWGTLKLSRGLSKAFGELYEQSAAVELRKQVVDTLIVFGSLAVAVTVLVGFDLAVALVAIPTIIVGPLQYVVLFVALVVALLPLYALLPAGRLSVRSVLPGTLVAAVGWILLRAGFALYTTYAADYQVYGVLGALLLFVTWLYLGAFVILFGAVVNAVAQSHLGEQ